MEHWWILSSCQMRLCPGRHNRIHCLRWNHNFHMDSLDTFLHIERPKFGWLVHSLNTSSSGLELQQKQTGLCICLSSSHWTGIRSFLDEQCQRLYNVE